MYNLLRKYIFGTWHMSRIDALTVIKTGLELKLDPNHKNMQVKDKFNGTCKYPFRGARTRTYQNIHFSDIRYNS